MFDVRRIACANYRSQTLKIYETRQGRIMFLYHHLKAMGSAAAEPFCNLSSKLMTVILESLISNNSGDECYDALAELVETTVKICRAEGLCTPKFPLDVTRTVQVSRFNVHAYTWINHLHSFFSSLFLPSPTSCH